MKLPCRICDEETDLSCALCFRPACDDCFCPCEDEEPDE